MMDYHLCHWPEGLKHDDESIARTFDAMNDAPGFALDASVAALRAEHPETPLITFSHFVPRQELNPEKRHAEIAPRLRGAETARRDPTALPGWHCAGTCSSLYLPCTFPVPSLYRYLFFPSLAKASGSTFLAGRIERLRPDLHVFGHTHFGWDSTLDGVRYIQAPLSNPNERKGRLGSVATGETFPHGVPPTPLLLHDSHGFPPR
jgi:hypothetical protein